MKNKKFRPFSNISAIKLSLTISVFLSALMFLGYIFNKDIGQVNFIRLISAFINDFTLFYLLFMFNFKIIQLRWTKAAKVRVISTVSLCIAIAIKLTFSKLSIRFLPEVTFPENLQIMAAVVKSVVVYMMVLLLTFMFYSVDERQQTLFENEKLIAENIRIRYEVLKSQVDPHFLFNSLNTLDGLIGIDDDKAHEYVQHLSSVFRYAIGNKEVMHLSEELDFAESFAHLMKIRYGDNFSIVYNIDEKYKSWFIMPVSIQLLIENAVKHNVISTKYPLTITIETTPNDTIRVMNPIHLKKEAEQGEGIGLANLSERYDLLFQKEVTITQTDFFCVEIPLIKHIEPAKTNLI